MYLENFEYQNGTAWWRDQRRSDSIRSLLVIRISYFQCNRSLWPYDWRMKSILFEEKFWIQWMKVMKKFHKFHKSTCVTIGILNRIYSPSSSRLDSNDEWTIRIRSVSIEGCVYFRQLAHQTIDQTTNDWMIKKR